jgi:hypothetical protein
MNKYFFPLIFLFVFGFTAVADETWGGSLFKVKQHDFGRVAVGSDTVYRFEIENTLPQEIRLVSVYSSCGCTIPSLSVKVLQSGEKGAVLAKFNTSGQHTHDKSATLTVRLERTVEGRVLEDTVLLSVSGYIRPDVVLTPGSIEFGAVSEGKPVVRTLQLDYTGRNNWALTKIGRSHSFIHAKAEEIRRNSSDVTYRISITLKDNAPVGYVKDVLRLSTNEMKPGQNEPVEIMIPIQGVVIAPLHVKPSPFLVGVLSPGEVVAKNIVVRGEMPFRITEITSDDRRFHFTYSDQESSVQLVSVLFSAMKSQVEEPTDIADTIRISTNQKDQGTITLDAYVWLTPKVFLETDTTE